MDVKGSGHGFF